LGVFEQMEKKSKIGKLWYFSIYDVSMTWQWCGDDVEVSWNSMVEGKFSWLEVVWQVVWKPRGTVV
jgi:hypothetical protein